MATLASLIPACRTVAKFARGPRGATALGPRIRNTSEVLRILTTQQLGRRHPIGLSLGLNGSDHVWDIKDRHDIGVLEDVFLDTCYAMEVFEPAVVFDLGANFGAASIAFAQLWPSALIYAVEPNPEMFQRLKNNASAYPNITCFCCAAGAADGAQDLFLSDDHVGSSLRKRGNSTSRITVDVRCLRTLMENAGVECIDLLKFDIEGSESDVFRDAGVLASIGALVGEVHPDLMSLSRSTFMRQFAGFDTTCEPLADGRFMLRAVAVTAA